MCKKWRIGALFFLVFCFATGCTLRGNRVQPFEESDALKASEVLRYFHHVQSLPQEELSRLYAYEERQFLERDNHGHVLKFALLLSLPDTSFQDNTRALELLDSYVSEENRPDPLKNLAFLLSHMIRERQHQEILHEMAKKELNTLIKESDEKEKVYQDARQKIDNILAEKKHQESINKELYKKLNKEKETVESLRKKIEKLKTIEKNINERKQLKVPAT